MTTAQIEEAIMLLDGVVECAVVGKKDNIKGHVPVSFVVAADFVEEDDVVRIVRQHVGAVASMKEVYKVQKLPKTRSQKILRNSLRQIAERDKFVNLPPTIEDASVLPEIEKVVMKNHRK